MPSELQIEAAREEHKYYPYTGIFFANRHSFWSAGQDSWTLPPAQNPDMFISLNNVEPVLQGILQRRRGYTLFSSTIPTNAFNLGYSFRSENLGLRSIVFTSASNVEAFGEDGSTLLNPIFTPSAGSRTPRMVLSRDYGYFADGTSADSVKWNGTTTSGNLTKWGIDVNNVASSPFGPNPPLTASTSTGQAQFPWTNPNNILVQDGNSATTAITLLKVNNRGVSGPLVGQNFNISVPSTGTITGIQVDIKMSELNSFTGFGVGRLLNGASVQLLKAGVATGALKSVNIFGGGSLAFVSFGGPNDLWGASWVASDFISTTFGMSLQVSTLWNGNLFGSPTSATATFNVDFVQITVFTKGSGLSLGATAAGNINLLNGRTYFYAFQNSKTGHTSGLSPASLSTGPLTNNNQVLNNIPTSLDAQVDTTLLLATADGNDQTTLFQLATLPNGTATYTDNIPDAISASFTAGTVLLSNALYLNTDQAGVIHGIANNNVPPLLNFPTKHKGRIFGAVGRALVFSKNLDEVTTANGLITSKWEEAWPATNQFDISEQAETIQGLLTDGETLWIATERAIRRLIGDSPINFQKPEVQFNETGLLNQETWKVVFMEGQPVGTMWLTPDFRVVASDFNTYLDVGTPIQDLLNSINPGSAQTAHAAYVNKGPADYYMLYIPTGQNTSPDTVCVYNLRSKKWFVWLPTDQITASLFLIDGSGQPRWLFATATDPLYEWTSGTFQDRIGNTPVSYPVTMQTSWLDLGDYTLRKFVNQIIPTTADQLAMTIQVDAASNELDFNAPLSVVPATTVIPAAIPTDVFVPLASGPSHSRAFRFTFVSPPSTIANVLTGFSVEAGSFHKY